MKLTYLQKIYNFIKPYKISVYMLISYDKYGWRSDKRFFFWQRIKAEHYCYQRFCGHPFFMEVMLRNLRTGFEQLHLNKDSFFREAGLTAFRGANGDPILDKNDKEVHLGDVVRCYGGADCAGAYEFDIEITVCFNGETFYNLENSEYIEIQPPPSPLSDKIEIGNNRIYSRKALRKDLERVHRRFKKKKDNVPIVISRSVISIKDMDVTDVEKKLDD